VHALLIEGCESCHAPGGAASSTELVYVGDVSEDYDATLEFVTPDSPESSRLVTKMQGRGHGGGAIFTPTSAEYALILTWIREGAAP
jgi:carbon monoxide dehydrogenase subunit G